MRHHEVMTSSRWSLWSQDSVLSIGSRGSVLSIGSVGSADAATSYAGRRDWRLPFSLRCLPNENTWSPKPPSAHESNGTRPTSEKYAFADLGELFGPGSKGT